MYPSSVFPSRHKLSDSFSSFKIYSLIIDLSPLIGIIVFSILFACVLKGRLLERVTHAILVFGIWMCATKFYCYILAHFKKKWVLISCIIGMLYSIGLSDLHTEKV